MLITGTPTWVVVVIGSTEPMLFVLTGTNVQTPPLKKPEITLKSPRHLALLMVPLVKMAGVFTTVTGMMSVLLGILLGLSSAIGL